MFQTSSQSMLSQNFNRYHDQHFEINANQFEKIQTNDDDAN